jgi:hypothetical protein
VSWTLGRLPSDLQRLAHRRTLGLLACLFGRSSNGSVFMAAFMTAFVPVLSLFFSLSFIVSF